MKAPHLTGSAGLPLASGAPEGGHHAATAPDPRGGTATTFAAALAQAERHPRHLPIGTDRRGGGDFQHTAMKLRGYRQQVIASNIANADTPGYKAVDVDLQEALRTAGAAGLPPLSLLTTASAHIQAQGRPALPPLPLKYSVPSQPSADGNTVDMDRERANFAENAVMYEFSVDRVSGHYKHMMELLKELK